MAARELPSGTVTFLFTDVEGSTRLLREHGDAYAELLAGHRRALRAAFASRGGVEVDTQGDAFFVAFRSAADALAAAAAARDALAAGPVRVRIGLHTGEALVSDDGYVGLAVHRAARIAAAAHGGQVLLSETTRRLLDRDLRLRDLGPHRLKDLTEPERLFQLGEDDFPPLRSLDATNLPVLTSGLVGRERELAELTALLSEGARLVTLTGPGGTGKTRLALQVAAELVGTLADGVFWVPLAGLGDPAFVEAEVAQTIGAPDDLAAFAAGRELLLLLDNFEHLLDAAPFVGSLLRASPGLRVLVTSRSPLRLGAEREYRVEPLPAQDAAALFAERAAAVGRQLAPDAVVEAICRRLDGLPLAIELAAARTKLLAPDGLLERLQSALPLLTGGARDAPERQRTLRATIEWSFDLLDEAGRGLFARLSVFAGSFTVEAAEEVCDATLDGLGALLDASLLTSVSGERLLMLETIREYAAERLAEEPDAGGVRARHAAFFAATAEEAWQAHDAAEPAWAARLEVDHDDLRAALDHLVAADPPAGLSLAGALGWFWLSHGHLAEGRARLAAALAASPAAGPSGARALAGQGSLLARLGDIDEGRRLLEHGIALCRDLGDDRGLAGSLEALGWLLVYDAGDDPAALAAFEQSLALRQRAGDDAGARRALVGVCQVLVALDETERAESLSRELLASAAGDARSEHFAHHFLADCSLIRGDCAEAAERYRESLRAAVALGDVIETSLEVQGVAMAAAGLGDARRALVLAGAVEALWESLGVRISVRFWDALLDRYVGAARGRLGGDAEIAWADGRALGFDDAVALALAAGP